MGPKKTREPGAGCKCTLPAFSYIPPQKETMDLSGMVLAITCRDCTFMAGTVPNLYSRCLWPKTPLSTGKSHQYSVKIFLVDYIMAVSKSYLPQFFLIVLRWAIRRGAYNKIVKNGRQLTNNCR